MNTVKIAQLDGKSHGLQLPGMDYIGVITNPHVNHGANVPLYEPIDRPGGINTREGWNALADKQNRRSFAIVFGRPPKDDAEFQAWEATL